jgi:cytochrome c
VTRIFISTLRVVTACVATVGFAAASGAAPAGNAKNGAEVFMETCAVCHSGEKGAPNKIGPNLFGVIGRKSASLTGYMYSPAMMKAGLTWDVPTLQVYLTNPQKKVPGTKMGFPGFSDPQDEADTIAYLATLK